MKNNKNKILEIIVCAFFTVNVIGSLNYRVTICVANRMTTVAVRVIIDDVGVDDIVGFFLNIIINFSIFTFLLKLIIVIEFLLWIHMGLKLLKVLIL